MLKSMTGFGVAQNEHNGTAIRAEIKTLNGKYLDVSVRLPRHYAEKEIELKSLLSKHLQRGSIYLNINIDYNNPQLLKKEINKPLLKEYFHDIEEISRELSLEKSNLLEVLMSLPDVMLTPEKGIAEEEWQLVTDTIVQAIEKVNSFREQEGESLKNDLLGYASVIEQKALEIDSMKAERLKNIKERLRGQVAEISAKDGYDEGRLEQELIYYSEKLDITEEIVRLKSHLDHYRQSLDEDNPGKKLGFIAQEIGREINTIGSKANDSRIQRTVVEMKDELEKMREQLLNIL